MTEGSSLPGTRARLGSMTILTPTAEHDVAAHDGLWMSPIDAERVTGWTLKPEGMCRADLCVPLPASALAGPNEVDLEAFWTKLGGPVVASEARDVWALGGAGRGAQCRTRRAARRPTSHLPDRRRRAALAVAVARPQGLPRHMGQLVRLPL